MDRPSGDDIEVFKCPGKGVRLHFFDRVDRIERTEDDVRVFYAAGGVVQIVTDKPLIWIEPERH